MDRNNYEQSPAAREAARAVQDRLDDQGGDTSMSAPVEECQVCGGSPLGASIQRAVHALLN